MKKNQFVLKRHKRFMATIGRVALYVIKKRYNIDVPEFEERDDQYLIMFNHQTEGDQFFIDMAFKKPVYFIASEDIFTKGFASYLLKRYFNPIPIKKNATDVKAVKQSLKVAKEGGTIGLAPEGNRTYSGETVYMNPAITKFAKSLKLPIAFFKIEGGYGIHPRWADDIRTGQMKGYVSKVLTYDEFKDMPDEELYEIIKKELYVNDCENRTINQSKTKAEYIERFIYYCPKCKLSRFQSNRDYIRCTKCGLEAIYMDDMTLKSADSKFKYNTLKDWYDDQNKYIVKTDLEKLYKDTDIYTDFASMHQVIPGVKKLLLSRSTTLTLFTNRIEVSFNDKDEHYQLDFDDINTISCVGKNKLNIYYKDSIYQFNGDKRFNAIKYMNIFFKYQNVGKDKANDEFLGL